MKKNERMKELESLSFEKALERLETIVSKMEGGKLPLEDMMEQFEEGSLLSSVCEKKLKELEKKIEILVKEDSDGGKWEEFDPDSSGKAVKAVKSAPIQSPDEEEENEEEEEEKPKDDTLF